MKMNKKQVIASIVIGMVTLTGCMTSPLVSSDPATRKQAVMAINDDKVLFFIAMDIKAGIKGQWPELYSETHIRKGEFSDDVRVAAVERLKNIDYLLMCASWNDGDEYVDPGYENGRFEYGGETYYCNREGLHKTVSPGSAVRNAAISRLSDLATLKTAAKALDEKARERILPKSPSKVARGTSSDGNAFIDCYGRIRPGNPLDKAFLTAIEKQKLPEAAVAFIYNAAEGGQGIAPETFTYAMNNLSGITPKVAAVLFRKVFVEHHCAGTKAEWMPLLLSHVDELDTEMAKAAIKYASKDWKEGIVAKVKSEEAAKALLGIQRGYRNRIVIGNSAVEDPKHVAKLLGLLDAKTVDDVAAMMLDRITPYYWSEDRINPMIAIAHAAAAAREDVALSLSLAVLKRISALKKDCDEGVVSWRKDSDERASSLSALLPVNKLSAESLGKLVASCGEASRYILPAVSVESARNLLLSNDVKSDDLEAGLVERIPPAQLDIALYQAVKSAKGKKVIMKNMPAAQKELAAKEQAKAIDKILASAKNAGKETLVFNGFYLGMPFEDAKAMFVHHFPDLEFTEKIDGSGDKADHCIYAPGQSNPFCFASVKDGKVWQFNFGKKLLKKWFKYDASTTRDWAKTFGREKGLEMKLDFIDRTGEVYTMNGMLQAEPHPASLHQEIWTYKSGTKNYRLTYFGKPDFGGYGAAIRELAREKWRYVTADEGTLRAVIDND